MALGNHPKCSLNLAVQLKNCLVGQWMIYWHNPLLLMPDHFKSNFERLCQSIQLRDYFQHQRQTEDDYIQELYIPSQRERPEILHRDMEQRMLNYSIKLE
jgi:hypothetical protein